MNFEKELIMSDKLLLMTCQYNFRYGVSAKAKEFIQFFFFTFWHITAKHFNTTLSVVHNLQVEAKESFLKCFAN